MNVNPFAVVTSLIGKMAAYKIEYAITSGSLLKIPKEKQNCVQLEATTKTARVVIRVFPDCSVEVDHLENDASVKLWMTMEIFLKTILGPASAGIIHHG
jgi:hypothetical protein